MTPRIVVVCLSLPLISLPAAAQDTATTTQPTASAPATITLEQAIRAAREKLDAGQKADALELIESVRKSAPNNTEANVLAGEIYMAVNRYDDARDRFTQALETEPSNFKANLGLGKIWSANRYWRQAVAFLEAAEKVAPQASRSEAKRLLATAYAGMGQTTKAIDKANEAVQAAPDDLASLSALADIHQQAAKADPQQTEAALTDVERYVQQAKLAVARKPWNRATLVDLKTAFDARVTALNAYYDSFLERDLHRQVVYDRLLPGKAADAAAVLVRYAEALRAGALLDLILAEHNALLLVERAVGNEYDPKNTRYLLHLAASYRQIQDLTARLVGEEVYNDKALAEKTIETYRRVLVVDPQNAEAQQYLKDVGAPPTPPPAAAGGAEGG